VELREILNFVGNYFFSINDRSVKFFSNLTYYSSSRRPRKRNPNADGSFSSEEDPSPNVSGDDYDRKRGLEDDGELDRPPKRFKNEYEQK
jgi:hypothetical protein